MLSSIMTEKADDSENREKDIESHEKTNSVTNDSNPEIEEIISKLVLEMYQMEWQRTHDIENKATGIVGFVGIIFSLTIGSLATIIASDDKIIREQIFSSPIFSPILILILFLMILSIIYGIMALNVKEWWFLIAEKFLNYCKKAQKEKELTKEIVYSTISEKVANGIILNSATNKKIANYLKWSYILFLISICLLVFYFIHIIDVSI